MSKKAKEILIGLMIALIIVVMLAPLASGSPDGLERVAEDLSFLDKAEVETLISSPIPDYVLPGLQNETLAGRIAGIIGTLLTFLAMYILIKLIRVNRKENKYPKLTE